jgi:PAT family acetyl-CoA transporter-like MFS transporter 1
MYRQADSSAIMTTNMSSPGRASKQKEEKPNIKGDRLNIVLLISLYTLQGVVLGLTQAFPIILQNRKVSYTDQVRFLVE